MRNMLLIGRRLDGVDLLGEDRLALADRVLIGAGANSVEDRGDAGSRHLRVIGDRGGERIGPAHLGTGQQMLLEVVGVDLDEAGNDEIALAIDGARQGGTAVLDGANACGVEAQRSGYLFIIENEPGVGEHRLKAPSGFGPDAGAWEHSCS